MTRDRIDKLHILQVFEWGYILYIISHTLREIIVSRSKIVDYRL